jgi:hypothetical protein
VNAFLKSKGGSVGRITKVIVLQTDDRKVPLNCQSTVIAIKAGAGR